MKNQTADFTNRIKSPEYEQDFILLQNDADIPSYFSANDGDFTSEGITIDSEFCNTGDVTFGHAEADKLDFTLINRNGSLTDFPWGEMSAFIGVVVEEHGYHGNTGKIPEDANCGVIYNDTVKFYGKDDGIYRLTFNASTMQTTTAKVYSTTVPIVSLVINQFGSVSHAMALGDGICVTFDIRRDTGVPSNFEEATPNRHMAQKLIDGKSIRFGYYEVYGVEHRCVDIYTNKGDFPYKRFELCSMGVYNINEPDSLQNETVQFNDAMSIITNFDEDATAFLATVTYPITFYGFLSALCAYKGFDVSMADDWGTSTEYISENPFTGDGNYTLRQVLAWTAEMFGGCATVYRDDEVDRNVVRIANSFSWADEIHADRIVSGSFAYRDFHTQRMGHMRIKSSDGNTYDYDLGVQTPSMAVPADGIYQVNGNPIADVTPYVATESPMGGYILSGGFQNLVRAITQDDTGYVPYSVQVVHANPTVELGDEIQLFTMESNTVPKYDIYGRIIENEYEDEAWIQPPVLRMTTRWVGTCVVTYSADGNKVREIDTSSQPYTNSYAVQYTNKAIAGLNNCYQATGSASSVSITSGTITQVELTETDAISYGGGFEITSDGGIKVTESGIYKVTGSVYHNIASSSAITRVGAYIMAGATFATATEVSSTYITRASGANGSGSYGIPSKLVNLDANDIVYLAARSAGDTGTAVGNNIATWLLIEKVG